MFSNIFVGSNPIVYGNVLVLNVGGGGGECIGFNRTTGKTLWVLEDEWGASYSSPTMATIHGQSVCLAIAGGESKPASGGLLIFNPDTGKRLVRFPWRSRKYESATACPPIYLGDGHIFISECYDKGSAVLRIAEDFTHTKVWENPKVGIHWMTPIAVDGYFVWSFRETPARSRSLLYKLEVRRGRGKNRLFGKQNRWPFHPITIISGKFAVC